MKPTLFITLFSIALFALTLTTKAQTSNEFSLKDYKTAYYNRTGLDVRFNLSQQSRSTKRNANESDLMINYTNNDYNGTFNSNFNNGVNALKHNTYYNGSFSVGGSSNNYDYVQNEESHNDKDFTSSFQLNFKSDYFLFSNQQFIHYGGYINYYDKNSNDESSINNIQEKIETTNKQFYYNLQLGYGLGRIENVEDAVEALYIINDLEKEGLLTSNANSASIQKLADEITILNNERYFDFRLHCKKTIKQLESILLENGIIKTSNVDVYTILNDYHYLANRFTRQSGQRFAIQAEAYNNRNWNSQTNENEPNQTYDYFNYTVTYQAKASYKNTKPLSIKWHREFYLESFLNKFDKSYAGIDKDKSYGFNCSGAIGYYPNSRTYVRSGISANYSDLGGFRSSLNTDLYYYISERLRLSTNFNISYNSNSDNSYRYFRNNLNATLSYAFI